VALCSDAIVVGSAIVNQIAAHGKEKDLVARVTDFTRSLLDPVKSLL
jgi:tryptophan synthase alpha subunit